MTWHFMRIDDMALHADRWHGTSRGSMTWRFAGGRPLGFPPYLFCGAKARVSALHPSRSRCPSRWISSSSSSCILVHLVLDLVHPVLDLVCLVLHVLRLVHQVVKGERRRELRRSQIYQIFLNIVFLQHLVCRSAISRFFHYYFYV